MPESIVPMSDERLAEIQRDLAPWLTAIGGHSRLSRAACELLAEVERLRDIVAEFGTTSIEWFVHYQGSTGRDYYEGPYDSVRDAQRAFGPISGKWNIVSRPVGEWREADR